jgi:serine protease inhibitor
MLPVAAINALTARWIAALPDDQLTNGTVTSGLGVWPLLAILADAADGKARDELSAAVGITADQGLRMGTAILEWLDATPGVAAALGLWRRKDLPVRDSFRDALPPDVISTFTGDVPDDQAALDAWASAHTDGLIPAMPVTIDADTLMVLASALMAETRWREPFLSGGWLLWRNTGDPSIVRVTPSTTSVLVEGSNGIDVELVMGLPEASPGALLSAAIGAPFGGASTSGAVLSAGYVGPGILVTVEDAVSKAPQCRLRVPAFTVRAHHDLCALGEVFGLLTVTDPSTGHLPGISTDPLAISAAAQDAVAEFSAEGFRAAAVTGISFMAGSAMPRHDHRALVIDVRFDGAFGFVARHTESGLVLAAGWVTDAAQDRP